MQNKIYYRQTNEWIEVSEEIYQSYYRDTERFRSRTNKRGECGCPHNKQWVCDTDCATCQYRKSGRFQSIDVPIADDCGITYADTIVDTSKTSIEIIQDKALLDELFNVLGELDEDSYQICMMLSDGCSEREIARILGIPNTTFQRRIKKLKNTISEKLKDFR